MDEDEQELKELQDEESWDDEGEVRPAVKPQRAVVSVAFSRDDFERVATYARRHGMKTSEFIRNAALSEVTKQPSRLRVHSVSGSFQTVYLPAIHRAFRAQVTTDHSEAAFTR